MEMTKTEKFLARRQQNDLIEASLLRIQDLHERVCAARREVPITIQSLTEQTMLMKLKRACNNTIADVEGESPEVARLQELTDRAKKVLEIEKFKKASQDELKKKIDASNQRIEATKADINSVVEQLTKYF